MVHTLHSNLHTYISTAYNGKTFCRTPDIGVHYPNSVKKVCPYFKNTQGPLLLKKSLFTVGITIFRGMRRKILFLQWYTVPIWTYAYKTKCVSYLQKLFDCEWSISEKDSKKLLNPDFIYPENLRSIFS